MTAGKVGFESARTQHQTYLTQAYLVFYGKIRTLGALHFSLRVAGDGNVGGWIFS